MNEFGPEGYVECEVCTWSAPCHLWAWGHPDTRGRCGNCGERRGLVWVARDFSPPLHNVIEHEFGAPHVN